MACQLSIECPSCRSEIDYPDPVPLGARDHPGRRISRLIYCECGVLIAQVDGRSYGPSSGVDVPRVDGVPALPALPRHEPDRDAFYTRSKGMGA